MTICPKRKFDKKGAQTALNVARKHHREEKRIYHCPICKYWHLTSKDGSDNNSNDSTVYTFNDVGWNDILRYQESDQTRGESV